MTEQQQEAKEEGESRTNFIDDFSAHILNHVDTKPLWAKTLAMTTLGVFLHTLGFESGSGRILTNVYACFIGASKISVKSRPNKVILTPIFKLVERGLRPKEDRKEEEYISDEEIIAELPKQIQDLRSKEDLSKEDKDKIKREWKKAEKRVVEDRKKFLDSKIESEKFLLTPDFSQERLSGAMSNRDKAIMIEEEFTTVLKAANSKSYLVTKTEFLSDAYDGNINAHLTFAHDTEGATDFTLSYITTTTYEIYRMPELYDTILQGFGNRLALVTFELKDLEERLAKPFDAKKFLGVEDFVGGGLRSSDSLKRENELWASSLVAFYNLIRERKWELIYEYEVEDEIKKFIPELRSKYLAIFKEDKFNLKSSYLANFELLILKYAIIIAASRMFYWNKEMFDAMTIDGKTRFLVSKDDVLEAENLLRIYEQEFEKLVAEWSEFKSVKQALIIDNSAILARVEHWFQSHSDMVDKDGFADRRTLIRNLHMNMKQFEEIEIECLERKILNTAGRSRILVRLRRDN
jgi:hypothetical protein